MILSPKQLKDKMPVSLDIQQTIQTHRATLMRILSGQDKRLALIVGPCSIHNIEGAKQYAELLKTLAEEVKDQFFIVMRTYFEKSRTSYNWPGLLSDPDMDESQDIAKGLHLTRSFLIDLALLGLPAGTEFVDVLTANYFEDLISWGSVGARTAQSQIHRQLASRLSMPVAFKNTTDGNISNAIYGAAYAKRSHTFLAASTEGQVEKITSLGNPLAHIVLRGGDTEPNVDKATIEQALHLLAKNGLHKAILIDCAHGNSGRNIELQKRVFTFVFDELLPSSTAIRGLMLESYLQNGLEEIAPLSFPYIPHTVPKDCSITDPCLDWKSTETLVRYAANVLRGQTKKDNKAKRSFISYA